MITAAQCKTARLLLGWSIKDLSSRTRSAVETIELFELNSPRPYKKTISKLRESLEAAWIDFFTDNEGAPMARLRKDGGP